MEVAVEMVVDAEVEDLAVDVGVDSEVVDSEVMAA